MNKLEHPCAETGAAVSAWRETDWNDPANWGVCYRPGKPTAADYDEAIEALQNAKTALVDGDNMGCRVCEDSGHSAACCHHNPLILARERAAAQSIWQCWHCGYEARNEAEAVEHFGRTEDEVAKCIRERAASPPPPSSHDGLRESSSVAGAESEPCGLRTETPHSAGEWADVALRNAAAVCGFMAAIKMAHAGSRADLAELRAVADRVDLLFDNASKVAASTAFGEATAGRCAREADAIRGAIVEIERYRALADEPSYPADRVPAFAETGSPSRLDAQHSDGEEG